MNKTLLLALILGVLVSCNSNNSNSEAPDAIDITDAIFTELSTDCTNYAEDCINSKGYTAKLCFLKELLP